MLREVIVPNSNQRGMWGGAYLTSFVKTKDEEFVVKGYANEIERYLKGLGVKYISRNLYHNEGKIRHISWETNIKGLTIYEGRTSTIRKGGKRLKRRGKATIYYNSNRIELKRLPMKYDKFINIINNIKLNLDQIDKLSKQMNPYSGAELGHYYYNEGFVCGYKLGIKK